MDAILRASYGDRDQRSINQRGENRSDSERIKKRYDQRHKPAQHEIPQPEHSPGYKPPFWNSKIYGAPHVHREKGLHKKKDAFVEFNRGVMHELRSKSESTSPRLEARQYPGPIDPNFNKSQVRRKQPGRGHFFPAELDLGAYPPVFSGQCALEERMRSAVKRRSRPHIVPKAILLAALGKVLSKRSVEVDVGDALTIANFIAAWKSLGVEVSEQQAKHIFNKYGQNSAGKMPALVFCDALLVGAPRLAMMAEKITKGAPSGNRVSQHGKILYPQCKKGVFAPSNFDEAAMKRSSQFPDAELKLEFVYGYDGLWNTANNIFTTDRGSIVYYTAAVGIVYSKDSHQQKFFLGHDDDILCANITTDRKRMATGQCGKDPCVIVWDPHSLEELQRLHHGYGFRGIQACHFSMSGSKLATIATDNSHSIFIWDIQKREILLQRKTQPGAPPAVYGVVWSKFEPSRLATFGQNHIKFWKLNATTHKNSKSLGVQVDAGQYGKFSTHCILSACFLPSGTLLSGTPQGKISIWKKLKCVESIHAHEKGPVVQRPDGIKTYGGVRCLILHSNNKKVLSGGSDGYMKLWDVSSGDLGSQLQRIPIMDHLIKKSPPQVRGVDFCRGTESLIIGTSSCDLLEVAHGHPPNLLIFGHQADIYGLAMNSKFPHVFATVCESEKVAIWNSKSHKVIRILSMGMKAMCGAFSPDGSQLAVGMKNGGIKVFDFGSQITQLAWCKTFSSSVKDMKYSPDGRYLAAASHDQFIDVFDGHNGFKRVSRCGGHSSTVLHIDWGAEGNVIQSNDQAYEVLHFNPLKGTLIKASQQDTLWKTWTCVLGFPVMGIWPKDSDGTDVNACDRSPSEKYLVTADDYGKVKLFNYPCTRKNAPSAIYGGHSSHVMNVRWSSDERYVVSVGGRDRSVFQWRVAARKEEKPAAVCNIKQLDSGGIHWG
ncbi:hypothetical protein BSKO_12944 [Bryopsis sp. KO-2023]|nr:hypothetical protein BSKO_12944 [Bryopsis sp. KO-2023]